MVIGLKKKYSIKILCIDRFKVYNRYKISKQHVSSKSETSLVESKNSLIRYYLARLNRRTKRYSKAFDMIEHSLLLFFHRKMLSILI